MDSGLLFEIVREPVITEKSSKLASEGKIVFKVAVFANKETIKKAVEHNFAVKVANVNTFNKQGKVKIFRGHKGKRNNQKYAIVTLEKGQNIDLGMGA